MLVKLMALLVGVLLLTTGSPFQSAFANSQWLETMAKQEVPPPPVASQASLALSPEALGTAALLLLALVAWAKAQSRRAHKVHLQSAPSNLLWMPRRK